MSELDDQVKGIKGWLTKQGYPLEMMISRSLALFGLGFIQGWHYEDPETNENREIDIITNSYAYGINTLLLQAIIECKYSSNPIVAFTYGYNLIKSPIEYWVPCNILGRQTLNRIQKDNRSQEVPVFRNLNTIAYSIKQVYMEEGKKGNKDNAYEAVMSVVKASYSLAKLYSEKITNLPSFDKSEMKQSVYIGLPVVVIGGPLFICYLDGNDNIAIEPRNTILLEWSYPKVGSMMIRVIQEKEIANFGNDVTKSINIFSHELNQYI